MHPVINLRNRGKHLSTVILGIIACTIAACIAPSQESIRDNSFAQEPIKIDESGKVAASQGLIKPRISPDAPPAAETPPFEPISPEAAENVSRDRSEERPDHIEPGPPQVTNQESLKPTKPSLEPTGGLLPKKPEAAAGTPEWEDQKVKQMALELAANLPEVKKARICYAVKENEWWIILYEDAGAFYELKQFIWDKDQDKAQPHLVLKKIAKSRFEDHIRQPDPDRVCEMLALPAKHR